MKAEIDREIDAKGPAHRHAVKLTPRTRDGRALRKELANSPGRPQSPLRPEQIIRKLPTLAGYSLPQTHVERLVDLAQRLDRLENINALVDVLAQARPVPSS